MICSKTGKGHILVALKCSAWLTPMRLCVVRRETLMYVHKCPLPRGAMGVSLGWQVYLHFTPNSGKGCRSAQAAVVLRMLVLLQFGRRFIERLDQL